MEFSRQEQQNGLPFLPPGDLPNPGIKPTSPTLQADSLPAKPQGKPKNTGVGSRSLLQQIFLTQESNQGLLHCRRILSQLSYHGSPNIYVYCTSMGFPDGLAGKESTCSAGDTGDLGSIDHWLGRSPGGRNGNPLQYSCLENPRDRGACWAAVYGVAQSRTRLMRLSSSSSRQRNLPCSVI